MWFDVRWCDECEYQEENAIIGAFGCQQSKCPHENEDYDGAKRSERAKRVVLEHRRKRKKRRSDGK